MIQEIKMPSAGQTTDEATIVKVNIKVGDTVKRGDELVEAETDKAILPVESFAAGEVLAVLVKEGDSVTAGTVLAAIGKARGAVSGRHRPEGGGRRPGSGSGARAGTCGEKGYQGRYVVIAAGSQPMMLPIPGRELCIDSTGALNLRNLPRSMAVMGGGVIGLELACAFAAYGTEVTIVELMPELMPREQKEAVRVVLKELKRQGIRLLTGAKMLRVEKSGAGLRAVYEQDGTEGSVDAEQVLMAAGRKPNFTGIDAGALGLAMNGKFIAVDNHQRTSLEGVYAIGMLWAAISWHTPLMPRGKPLWRICWGRMSLTATPPGNGQKYETGTPRVPAQPKRGASLFFDGENAVLYLREKRITSKGEYPGAGRQSTGVPAGSAHTSPPGSVPSAEALTPRRRPPAAAGRWW